MKPGEYKATTAPRRHKTGPTHWAFVEREGEHVKQDGPRAQCRDCGTEGSKAALILHPDPSASDGRRVLCGGCQGRANAERSGMAPR